jgi:hypothetical protein
MKRAKNVKEKKKMIGIISEGLNKISEPDQKSMMVVDNYSSFGCNCSCGPNRVCGCDRC